MERNRYFPLVFGCITFFLIGNAWTIMPVIGNLLMSSSDFKFSNSQYASLGFGLLFSAIFFSWASGVFGHKKGMKIVLLLSLLLFGIACTFYSVANLKKFEEAFWLLMGGQILLGIGISGLLTSLSSYLVLLMPQSAPTVLTGMYFCTNLGSFAFPLLFSLYSNQNWGFITAGLAAMILLLLLLGIPFLPDKRNPHPIHHCSSLEVLPDLSWRFWVFFGVVVFYSLTENTFASWAVIYLHQVKNLSDADANFGLSLFWGVVGIGQLSICILMRWVNPRFFYRILPLLIILGYYGIYFSSDYLGSVWFFVISGLGCSAFFALSISFVESEFRPIAEIASGIMVMAYFLGSGLGSLIFGVLLEFKSITLSGLFFVMGIIPVVIAIVNQFLARKRTLT